MMDWIQVNGNWIKNPGKDPDTPPNILEEDPDIPKENKNAEETMITPPRKRLRKKTTPDAIHITQRDNITIAYTTPLTSTKHQRIHQQTHPYAQQTHSYAQIRGDLLSTSKYYQYHKAMGHTPQHKQLFLIQERKKDAMASELVVPSLMKANAGE